MGWLSIVLTGFLLLTLQAPANAQPTLDHWLESFQAQFKQKWQRPASQKTALTLSLRINRSGYPVAVEVLESSEEPEVIRVAVEAVRKAAPYPPLPAQLEAPTDNAVQLAKVSQPTEADILVYFTAVGGTIYVGLTETRPVSGDPRAFGNKIAALQIQLNLAEALRYRSQDRLKYVEDVATHEFGHALGMLGHSDSIDDIMYPAVNGMLEPSPRDLATLKKLYSIPPDITRP